MSSAPDWFGLLNVDKPAAWTSRRAVDHIKRIVRPVKVGHAGTLDPLATGVLIICVGPATRLVPYLHELRKQYRAEFLLGCRSETDDLEGDVETIDDAPVVTFEQIERVLPQFLGTISQIPPTYSAVKIRGRRAYELARTGRPVRLTPRQVQIDAIRLINLDGQRLTLEITCGSGTYIRSLGRDLAEALGSGAVMSRLTRISVGPFTLDTAIAPQQIQADSFAGCLLSPQSGLVRLPQFTATPQMLSRFQRGLRCNAPKFLDVAEGGEIVVLTREDDLAAIVQMSGGELQPRHVFVSAKGAV